MRCEDSRIVKGCVGPSGQRHPPAARDRAWHIAQGGTDQADACGHGPRRQSGQDRPIGHAARLIDAYPWCNILRRSRSRRLSAACRANGGSPRLRRPDATKQVGQDGGRQREITPRRHQPHEPGGPGGWQMREARPATSGGYCLLRVLARLRPSRRSSILNLQSSGIHDSAA